MKISSSGIWNIDDETGKIHQLNLVGHKGAVWIYRFDQLGSQTYIIKRRTVFVRMNDWFNYHWSRGRTEFVLSAAAMTLIPLWVFLTWLGL